MEILEKKLLKRLLKISNCDIFVFENLKNYISFRPENSFCKYLLKCHNEKSLIKSLKILQAKSHSFKAKHIVIGNGSNILFKDNLYDGFVIKLGKQFKNIKILKSEKDCVYLSVGAAVNLFALNHYLKEHSFGGLEWSFGIPGSMGGAVIMNAGAFNNQISNFIERVKVLKRNRFVWTNDFKFEYRNSSFKQNKEIISEVIIKVKKSNKKDIEKLQQEFLNKRFATQPHEYPSAGSVFKRIINGNETIFPAKLIDNLGLKNVKIGGAKISEKHAGFIINSDNATAQNFIDLTKFIKDKVKAEYNLDLTQEVEIIEWGKMYLIGDYHTHTIYSSGKHSSKHAKGTIYENALIAKQKGLSEIGITEHGLCHKLYGLQKKNIVKIRKEIEQAQSELGIKILLGIEANLISSNGDIDMTEEEISLFDYIVVGFHSFAKAKSVCEYFKFFLPNLLGLKRKKDIERNTKSLTMAMQKYPIKFISHPGVNMPLDFNEVCRVANETNTMLEINGKRIAYKNNDVKILKKLNVKLIINSDAHKPSNVGEIKKPLNFILKNNIPLNLINNLK